MARRNRPVRRNRFRRIPKPHINNIFANTPHIGAYLGMLKPHEMDQLNMICWPNPTGGEADKHHEHHCWDVPEPLDGSWV